MMSRCEWCGESLFDSGPPAGDGTASGGQVHAQPPYDGYGPPGEPPSGLPPSEWGHGAPPGPRPPAGGGGRDPWYMSPWPYVAGILILLAAVGALFLFKGKATSYPDLVVNGRATLLDFYTDT